MYQTISVVSSCDGASHMPAAPKTVSGMPSTIHGARRPHDSTGKSRSRLSVPASARRATKGPLRLSRNDMHMPTAESAATLA
eukprot:3895386-Prymnesium_polylepis.1